MSTMSTDNWFVPYLPLTKAESITSFRDGKEYGEALLTSLETAEHYVLLTGLHFMADYQLVRPDKTTRLATVLQKVAQKAEVFLLVNQFFDDEGRMTQQAKRAWAVRSKLYSGLMKSGELNGYLEETYKLFEELKPSKNIHCRTAIHDHPFFGTQHQKTVIVDGRIAFLGGIDLTFLDGDRWDSAEHKRTYRASTRTQQYWHDVHMSVEGAAVGIIQDNFRQRWQGDDLNTLFKAWTGVARGDPTYTVHIQRDNNRPRLPSWPTPTPFWYPASLKEWATAEPINKVRLGRYISKAKGHQVAPQNVSATDAALVQIVRSMPAISGWEDLKPKWNLDDRDWERSAKDAYLIGIKAAREYIYLENQWVSDEHIWSELLRAAERNKRNPTFRIVIVVPYEGLAAARLGSNQDGGFLMDINIKKVIDVLGDRFGMYSPVSWDEGLDELERPQIYVHSKILVVDDVWALIGSANAGGISLEGARTGADKPDTELSAIVYDRAFVTKLRHALWSEHLEKTVTLKYSPADADLFRRNALAPRRRIRYYPIYKAPSHHRLLQTTIREVQSLSRIEVYGVNPEQPFSILKLPQFRLIVAFPVPATNWGIYLRYRWVLRLGNIGSRGVFEGLPNKNYKLLNGAQIGDTFNFGFQPKAVVGQLTADAIQQWLIDNNRTDQWGQVSCRVQMIPFDNPADASDFVIQRNFLLLEEGFAAANTAP